MFIDTHCHLNMMVKKEFDRALSLDEITDAQSIIMQAQKKSVTAIINVGTSLIESSNSILLAQQYNNVYATVGIHPNDCTNSWHDDIKQIKKWLQQKELHKIVGIGECGLDRHYQDYNIQRQYDAFKMQIDLALEYDLALVVHSRDAYDETLRVLEEYNTQIKRGIIHCFSYDQKFADAVIEWHYALGIDAPITYPKNEILRNVAQTIPLTNLVLETDAPFLPPQELRGKQNHPENITLIAEYIAQLRNCSIEEVGRQTTANAQRIFNLNC